MSAFRLLRQQDFLNEQAKAGSNYDNMNDEGSIITDGQGSGEEDSDSDIDEGEQTMSWDAFYNHEVVIIFAITAILFT